MKDKHITVKAECPICKQLVLEDEIVGHIVICHGQIPETVVSELVSILKWCKCVRYVKVNDKKGPPVKC